MLLVKEASAGSTACVLVCNVQEIFDDALIADRDTFLETIPRSTDSFL